jgi:hypothetical protein
MLTATELQKSFQWRTKNGLPISVFDVEEAKIVKAELGDNTILVWDSFKTKTWNGSIMM